MEGSDPFIQRHFAPDWIHHCRQRTYPSPCVHAMQQSGAFRRINDRPAICLLFRAIEICGGEATDAKQNKYQTDSTAHELPDRLAGSGLEYAPQIHERLVSAEIRQDGVFAYLRIVVKFASQILEHMQKHAQNLVM